MCIYSSFCHSPVSIDCRCDPTANQAAGVLFGTECSHRWPLGWDRDLAVLHPGLLVAGAWLQGGLRAGPWGLPAGSPGGGRGQLACSCPASQGCPPLLGKPSEWPVEIFQNLGARGHPGWLPWCLSSEHPFSMFHLQTALVLLSLRLCVEGEELLLSV